jgi:ferritin
MAETGKASKFSELVLAQVGNEFTASQQYIALAVRLDAEDLPRLAKHFYRQAVEERNHAMALVRHLLDRGHRVEIPGVVAVRNDFSTVREMIELALAQEREVAEDIAAIARAAKAGDDLLGEQFMHWFLKEQVEEIAQMSTLLTVVDRAGGNLFEVENYLFRESVGDGGADRDMPPVAGGRL